MHEGNPAHHDDVKTVPVSCADGSNAGLNVEHARKRLGGGLGNRSTSNLSGKMGVEVPKLGGSGSSIPSKPKKRFSPTMNLYFFRNMITGKVIISKQFQLESSLLNQIGEHRPSLRIRQDHWVPFTVLTGLPPTLPSLLQEKLTTLRHIGALPLSSRPYLPKGVFGKPRIDPAELWVGWSVPEMVKSKTLMLCEVLGSDEVVEVLKEEKGGMGLLTLWWEREEFRYLVERERRRVFEEVGVLDMANVGAVEKALRDPVVKKEAGRFEWPEFVAHRRLNLVRNRYPQVPGMTKEETMFR
ncbi:hypothetical protein BC829DRAFT_443094 [Chytridium lagenaria]|nr:hypothetical protein BC829DRAFT_443094 [Chytridium lagenaria]